ncbi:MAG: histidinol dehydrogenase, partial [Acidiferrobacteraceae bacterium]|nr:histidinol dehydrogenase [Acidiferrobacteraceae bacterium]
MSAADFEARLAELLNRTQPFDAAVEETVRGIIERVRCEGDAALLALTAEFDELVLQAPSDLELPKTRLDQARAALPDELSAALEQAAQRIRAFHERQFETSWQYQEADGT